MFKLGVPKEKSPGETRVAISPDTIKRYVKLGAQVLIENGAIECAGFSVEEMKNAGAQFVSEKEVFGADLVVKINKPLEQEIAMAKENSLWISLLDPHVADGTLEKLAVQKVNAVGLELIPRTSRAQSMDVLSSQANIGGYRAVLEAAAHYPRFFPMMMTSAGSAKAARVMILGAGVAGLQAIGSAKRLGAQVEAYDVRPEVKEQIQSLGGKFIELTLSEAGAGTGGYAKELSAEGKAQQQKLLTEYLKKADVIITTASIPGKKAPILITEEAVKGMRPGSVIIDMAALTGGNCELTEPGKNVVKYGVKIIGITHYPRLVPYDSSQFFAKNIFNLVSLFVVTKEGGASVSYNMEDDIIAAALVTYQGQVRYGQK